MIAESKQSEIAPSNKELIGFLIWPIIEKYYMESGGGRFVIAKAKTGNQMRFIAYLKNNSIGLNDFGLLGAGDSVDEAVSFCEQFEINLQANHIQGKFYGAGL